MWGLQTRPRCIEFNRKKYFGEKGQRMKPTFEVLSSPHGDLIHDIQYNYYGNKLATCSSDQSIKVWEIQGGQWKQTAEWKSHDGSVW